MNARLETITNFGANISFTPRQVYRPGSESEVLDILQRHKHEHIRVVGRLHGLSEAMGKMFDARCHWGKYCPIDADRVRRNYPEIESYLRIARAFDAKGQFLNDWLASIMATSTTGEVIQPSGK